MSVNVKPSRPVTAIEMKFTPGYTGFKPRNIRDDQHEFQTAPKRSSRFNIPGYSGFVPSVKAENIIGTSYAKASGMSR